MVTSATSAEHPLAPQTLMWLAAKWDLLAEPSFHSYPLKLLYRVGPGKTLGRLSLRCLNCPLTLLPVAADTSQTDLHRNSSAVVHASTTFPPPHCLCYTTCICSSSIQAPSPCLVALLARECMRCMEDENVGIVFRV